MQAKTEDALNEKATSSEDSIQNKKTLPILSWKQPQLMHVELSKITDTHKATQAIKNDLSIRPMRLPAISMENDINFRKLFDYLPILVVKVGQKIQCIGCCRLFTAARAILNPNTKIWCFEIFDISDEEIQQLFVYEFIYLPLVYGVHFGERAIVNAVAEKAFELNKWTPPQKYLELKFPVVSYISKIYGIDDRALYVTRADENKSNHESPTDGSNGNIKNEDAQ